MSMLIKPIVHSLTKIMPISNAPPKRISSMTSQNHN